MTMESLPPENMSVGTLELGRHLAEDVDRLGLEGPEMRQAVMARSGRRRAVRTLGVSHRARCRQQTLPFVFPR